MKYLLSLLLALLTMQAQAQFRDTFPEDHPEVFQRKMRLGITFHQTWTTIIAGNAPFDYFAKPSLGGGVEFHYFFSKNWGLGLAFHYQQRGAGIITPDFVAEIGNADSTYRHRLRMNTLDLPIKLQWRANKGFAKGTRWSGSAGLVPIFTPLTKSVFHSIEDGFHVEENWNKDFNKFDLAATLSFGIDANAAEAALFQAQLYTTLGLLNPYKKTGIYSNAKGFNFLIGIKLAALF